MGDIFTKGGQFPLVHFVRGDNFTSEYCPGGHFSRGDTIPSDNSTIVQAVKSYSGGCNNTPTNL